MRQLTDRSSQQARRLGSGVHDCFAVYRRVSAIHAPTCKIDHHIGIFEFRSPLTQVLSIPTDNAPWRWNRLASKDNYLVSLRVEMSRQDSADLSITTRDNHTETVCHQFAH